MSLLRKPIKKACFNSRGSSALITNKYSHRFDPGGEREARDVGDLLVDLLMVAMQVAHDRLELDDRLPVERRDHPEDAMGRGMLRPKIDFKRLDFCGRGGRCHSTF